MEITNNIILTNENNKYYVNREDFLINLKKKIEELCIEDQKEILKLLIKNNVNISENNNGSFINISTLKDEFLFKIHDFVNIKSKQQEFFDSIENEKERIKQIYMS